MKYEELVLKHLRHGIPVPCPSCFEIANGMRMIPVGHILPLRGGAIDALSSRKPQKICKRCEKVEGLMRYMEWEIDLALAPAYQDWAEAIRLPEGVLWGQTRYPTGGWDAWVDYQTRCETLIPEFYPQST